MVISMEQYIFENPAFLVGMVLLGILVAAGVTYEIMRHKTRALRNKGKEDRNVIIQSLQAIANAIDANDEYSSGHSLRVAAYSVEIARHMEMDKEFIDNIYYIGLLHDIGKIGISTTIIKKLGKLTDEEYESMKAHTIIGLEIVKNVTAISGLTAGVGQHHERWDGKGYHEGLEGEDIALTARIIAVADAYDAMSSERSYRTALPKNVIVQEFEDCAGLQFDPTIAAIARELIENGDFEKASAE
ncbi:MAG: HD-GYP domain-containing protein [Oscillospiraceae bacterium]|nr:HD-GYP domain-containing protein [Oscillospiraceae bacterium]